jgi:radical SAM/CxCxxxxC motif protein YfkAB
MIKTSQAMLSYGPDNDRWDPLLTLEKYGRHRLTSVELTVTNLCNMRCEHCAVGETLAFAEPPKMPLADVLRMLDQVDSLETLSITGGEPMFRADTVREYILPILKYARDRGVLSQLNSNLTLDYAIYETIAPFLDVLHMSYNYTDVRDFHEIGFARASHAVAEETAAKLYERMIDNAVRLSDGGLFVSAESMINYRTWRKMPEIHRHIAEMGCRRHEVHPMYPSDFAAELPMLSRAQMRTAIHALLDARDRSIWMLFGTLPFYACSPDIEDRELLRRLQDETMVTVRNDPDGRNRLNVDLFTGNVHVTDFAELSALGNVRDETLEAIFERWQQHELYRAYTCYCPGARCCGPNLLVADMYYRDVDFRQRKAYW